MATGGGQCVMTPGTTGKPQWSANSWVTMVRGCYGEGRGYCGEGRGYCGEGRGYCGEGRGRGGATVVRGLLW